MVGLLLAASLTLSLPAYQAMSDPRFAPNPDGQSTRGKAMREIAIPEHIREFALKEYSLTLPTSLQFPYAISPIEMGGVLVPQEDGLIAIEVQNALKLRTFYAPDPDALAQLGDALVLGFWHTHFTSRGPTRHDKAAVKAWAEIDVPILLIIGPRREWWLLPEWE
jgi:hypothetical protein